MNKITDVVKVTIKFTFKDGRTERAVVKNPDVVLGAMDYAVGAHECYDPFDYLGHYEPSSEIAEKHTHVLKWYPLVFDLRIMHKGKVRVTKRKPDVS